MENQNDENLVKAYLKGDEKALELLIQKYLKPLYNFAYKYTHTETAAEDVVQETMVKIWKNIKKFDQKRKFKTWAYTVAKNTALDYLKKKDLVPFSAMEENEQSVFLQNLVSPGPLPEKIMSQIDDAQMLNLKVNRLPEKYREIITLYYHKDFNFREISELLKISIDTIKTRHRRAIIYLKEKLFNE